MQVRRLVPQSAILWAVLSVAALFGGGKQAWAGMISLGEPDRLEVSPLAAAFGFATVLDQDGFDNQPRISAATSAPDCAARSRENDDTSGGATADSANSSNLRSDGRRPRHASVRSSRGGRFSSAHAMSLSITTRTRAAVGCLASH